MSKQASDTNMGENPLSSSFSSTLNRSFHGNLAPSSSSTRNHPSLEEGGQSSSMEHIRLNWTADLHRRFLNAVEFLGGVRSATPGAIIDLMKEKDLTLNQVGSHLQMYRNFCFAQQQAARGEAAAAQMGLTGGQNYGWSAPVHYQQAYPYGHHFYTAPLPHLPSWPQPPLPLPGPPRLYIDPVRPFPPNTSPLMRMMNFSSASRQETILFEELFQECRKRPPIDVVSVDDEEENVRLELMIPGSYAAKRPKVDLTLTLKPPVNEGPDSSRPHA